MGNNLLIKSDSGYDLLIYLNGLSENIKKGGFSDNFRGLSPIVRGMSDSGGNLQGRKRKVIKTFRINSEDSTL